jgi:U3 small nucleolar RNA-associated protein 21
MDELGDAKAKEWDSILTCHVNDNAGRTWSLKNKKLGDYVLSSRDKTAVKVREKSIE